MPIKLTIKTQDATYDDNISRQNSTSHIDVTHATEKKFQPKHISKADENFSETPRSTIVNSSGTYQVRREQRTRLFEKSNRCRSEKNDSNTQRNEEYRTTNNSNTVNNSGENETGSDEGYDLHLISETPSTEQMADAVKHSFEMSEELYLVKEPRLYHMGKSNKIFRTVKSLSNIFMVTVIICHYMKIWLQELKKLK